MNELMIYDLDVTVKSHTDNTNDTNDFEISVAAEDILTAEMIGIDYMAKDIGQVRTVDKIIVKEIGSTKQPIITHSGSQLISPVIMVTIHYDSPVDDDGYTYIVRVAAENNAEAVQVAIKHSIENLQKDAELIEVICITRLGDVTLQK